MVSDNGFSDLRPVPTELELLCDLGHALYVANQENEDGDGLLFELIAVFDDLLRAVKLTVPAEYAIGAQRRGRAAWRGPGVCELYCREWMAARKAGRRAAVVRWSSDREE